VLFNSGGPLYTDFIGVELVDGHVTLRVNKGADDVTLTSHAPVDDGDWHRVRELSVKLKLLHGSSFPRSILARISRGC